MVQTTGLILMIDTKNYYWIVQIWEPTLKNPNSVSHMLCSLSELNGDGRLGLSLHVSSNNGSCADNP